MPSSSSRLLIVDANVARSCGESGHPRAKACREVLRTILRVCHRVALNSELKDELEQFRIQRQQYFQTWRTAMQSRGKIEMLGPTEDAVLRQQIRRTRIPLKNPQSKINRMIKDLHLIEAALASDGIVLSLDETARKDFNETARSVESLRRIVWVNPEQAPQEAISWLRNGAPDQAEHRLGSATIPTDNY